MWNSTHLQGNCRYPFCRDLSSGLQFLSFQGAGIPGKCPYSADSHCTVSFMAVLWVWPSHAK